MKLIAISDIHIWGPDDPCYRALLGLIREEANSETDFILAGDIFDFLVGNRAPLLRPYDEFFQLLMQKATEGTRFHYIEGNHDFHLRKTFAQIPGMKVADAEIDLTVGRRKFYIAHGDLVDDRDWKYLGLRATFRSLPVKFAIKNAPSSLVRWVGERSSAMSRKHHPRLPENLPPEELSELRKVYRNFSASKIAEGYDYVILGHCHDQDEKSFRVGQHDGQYFNVGFPRIHKTYLEYDTERDELRRERFY